MQRTVVAVVVAEASVMVKDGLVAVGVTRRPVQMLRWERHVVGQAAQPTKRSTRTTCFRASPWVQEAVAEVTTTTWVTILEVVPVVPGVVQLYFVRPWSPLMAL